MSHAGSAEQSSNTVTMKMLHMVRSFRNRGEKSFKLFVYTTIAVAVAVAAILFY